MFSPFLLRGYCMLKQVRLINCQSWEDCSFNLSTDRLNVISGLNSTGKSVFFKMLKITCCPKCYSSEEQRELIRWGAECATVMYLFNTENIALVQVYPTRVVYNYKKATDTNWERTLYPMEELLIDLGLIADSTNSFIANVIDADQDLLLVDSNASSNYDLIRMLIFQGDLEGTLEKVKELKSIFRDKESSVINCIDVLNIELNDLKFLDVDNMEYSLSLSRIALDVMYKCIDVLNALQILYDVTVYYKDYEILFQRLDVLQSLDSMDPSGILLKKEPESITLVDTLQSLENLAVREILLPKEPCSVQFTECLLQFEYLQEGLSHLATKRVVPESLMAVELLQQLELVTLSKICVRKPVDFDRCDSACEALSILEQVHDTVLQIQQLHEHLQDAGSQKDALETLLRKNGDILKCPIYQEVIFNGKECIPNSY